MIQMSIVKSHTYVCMYLCYCEHLSEDDSGVGTSRTVRSDINKRIDEETIRTKHSYRQTVRHRYIYYIRTLRKSR